MGKLMHLIPPFLMLFGVILIVSGILNAFYTIEVHPSDTQIVLVYPRLLVGSMIGIVGVVVSVFSYLIIHNKIRIARYFRDE